MHNKIIKGCKNLCVEYIQFLELLLKKSNQFLFHYISTIINCSKEKLFELISIIIYKEENKPNNYSVYCKKTNLKKWFLFCDTECYPINNIEEENILAKVVNLEKEKQRAEKTSGTR